MNVKYDVLEKNNRVGFLPQNIEKVIESLEHYFNVRNNSVIFSEALHDFLARLF